MWLSPPLLCTAAGDRAGCFKLGWGGGRSGMQAGGRMEHSGEVGDLG